MFLRQQYRAETVVLEFHEKVKVEAAVSEHYVEPTIAAIRTFQRKLGNPETGVLTQAELVHLLNH